MYSERIKQVQNYLISNNIDGYIEFICDDHGSEYVNDHYKGVAFLSAFTGSAATLLITKNASYLWTDGRYFLQASKQLLSSNTTLKKIGIDESIIDFINNNLKSVAFDFRVANVSFVKQLVANNIEIVNAEKLLDSIWTNRPKLPKKEIISLPLNVVSNKASVKCHKELNHIKSKKEYFILVTALDDIAYLLNARGFDIKCNPVFISFLLLNKTNDKEIYTLYIDKAKVNSKMQEYFKNENINLKPYNSIYNDIKKINSTIYFDSNKTNYKLYSSMKNGKDITLWVSNKKAIKSKVEIIEDKKVHIKDAISMCKFLYYVKTYVNKKKMTELSLMDKLYKLRRKYGSFEPSFTTICGFNENGAIVHYSATNSTNKEIKNNGLLLVDSGGQYYYGTTDITRTIALNNISDEMKYHFTLVLKSHIALANAVFTNDTTDAALDNIARKPLWDVNLDFNHGTGHGVGYMLNVHEGPQSIRYNKKNPVVMKKGMITSDEPGLYFENQYGIRHENELLCVKNDKNTLKFEVITYVPFDLDGIDVNLLTTTEKEWLNNYHEMVYNKVNKYLTKREREFLKKATRKI
ncbi:MAG: aminopeptidase P family protein [Candidatus Caccosoma sp.]|nr:aminopeptidase P family protein [Candidatus Caccosoma sp.]